MHAAGLMLLVSLTIGAEPKLELDGAVQMLSDRAGHSAFTDLIRFRDEWYCVFREAEGHVQGAGKFRVLASKEGRAWESVALLAEENVDLRDPKVCLTPDGRLMLHGGGSFPATRDPVQGHYSCVSFSVDGREWTPLQRTLTGNRWLWRVTWHQNVAYGVAYLIDPKLKGRYGAALYKSPDGVKYEQVADFEMPQGTEATLAFDGDTMLCLQRRDGKPNSAKVGRSEPPYTTWSWKDLGHYLGGPALLRTPDGTWWAAGRLVRDGKLNTVVGRLDVEAGMMQPTLTLPSGGDTSYPGMVWHNGRMWISYYSTHEGKTRIYLARARLEGK